MTRARAGAPACCSGSVRLSATKRWRSRQRASRCRALRHSAAPQSARSLRAPPSPSPPPSPLALAITTAAGAHVHEPLRRAVHEPRVARGVRRYRRLGRGSDGGPTLTVVQARAARAHRRGRAFALRRRSTRIALPGRSARSTPRCSPSGSAASRRRRASSRWGRSYPRSAGWRSPISRPVSTAA